MREKFRGDSPKRVGVLCATALLHLAHVVPEGVAIAIIHDSMLRS